MVLAESAEGVRVFSHQRNSRYHPVFSHLETECRLISGAFDYSLRMRCRDMEHYRVLTETWMNNDELHIDKLVAHPELAAVKSTAPMT